MTCPPVANRGVPIRTPRRVSKKDYGYMEDRRSASDVSKLVSGRESHVPCVGPYKAPIIV